MRKLSDLAGRTLSVAGGPLHKSWLILQAAATHWEALRPLMPADDEATFRAYRDRTREGLPHRSVEAEEADARTLLKTIAELSEPALNRPAKELDPDLYFHPASGED